MKKFITAFNLLFAFYAVFASTVSFADQLDSSQLGLANILFTNKDAIQNAFNKAGIQPQSYTSLASGIYTYNVEQNGLKNETYSFQVSNPPCLLPGLQPPAGVQCGVFGTLTFAKRYQFTPEGWVSSVLVTFAPNAVGENTPSNQVGNDPRITDDNDTGRATPSGAGPNLTSAITGSAK